MTLKVLTYNIHKGFSSLGLKYTLEQLKKNISDAKIDICFLQEVVGKKNNIKNGQIENQLEYLADSVWPYFAYGKNASYPQGDHGNAILSRLPIMSENNLNLTLSPLEQRGLQHLQSKHPETQQTLHLLNTHLNLRTKDRVKQIKIIHSYIHDCIPATDPIILCGDFNDWNKSVNHYIHQNHILSEVHESLSLEIPKTFPSLYPAMCLDRIYSKNIKVNFAKTLTDGEWTKLSDHIPILAEFEI